MSGVKDKLLAMRSEIIRDAHRHTRHLLGTAHSGDVTDLGDLSVRDHDVHVMIRVAAAKSIDLRAIEAALARIEKGTYGMCHRCGEVISPARLEARPFAVVCKDCAEKGQN